MESNILIIGKPDNLAADLIDYLVEKQSAGRIWFLLEKGDIEDAITNMPKLPPLELLIGDMNAGSLGIENPLTLWEETTHILYFYEYHGFGASFSTYFLKNIDALKNTLNFALKIKNLKQFIFLSSAFVSGINSNPYPEAIVEHDSAFRNHYERSKYFAEIEISKKWHLLPFTVLRPPFILYTNRKSCWTSYAYHIANYMRLSRSILGPHYIGNGNGRMDFVDFGTFKETLAKVFDNPKAIGQVYNLTSSEPIPADRVMDAFAEVRKNKVVGRVSASIARTVASIFGSFFGLPHDMIDYFSGHTDYVNENLKELGIEPPSPKSLIKELSRLAVLYQSA